MAFGLGPRANRVYESLYRRITSGGLPPGAMLPTHTELARQCGVAPPADAEDRIGTTVG